MDNFTLEQFNICIGFILFTDNDVPVGKITQIISTSKIPKDLNIPIVTMGTRTDKGLSTLLLKEEARTSTYQEEESEL